MLDTKRQLYFEMVEPGAVIPPLEKSPSYVQLFNWSAVFRVTHRIHYDQAYARSEGHRDVIVQGPLEGAFLAQMLTDWIGPRGFLKRMRYQNRGSAVPGDVLRSTGQVTAKYVQDGQNCVDCTFVMENQHGELVVRGSATVVLPSREA